MRLLGLDLERYGPFTNRSFAFPNGRPLVLVHGPNEAGKSSALAGLIDALYGIEPRSRFDFLHDYGSMRVGASVENRAGQRLVFRRRKGNKATLLDEAGQPLADDALLPFLGRVDRAMFMEAFGLDQARLRSGAEALTRGEGSLGEALLAAAPGLGRLIELRRSAAEKAGALFSERRSGTKPFYRAFDQWDEARRRVADASLTAEALAKAEAALKATRDEVARIDDDRRRLKTEEARVARLARALPRLARLDGWLAELARAEVPPGIDEAFAEAVTVAGSEIARAATALDLHRRERDLLVADLDTISISPALLADGATIDRLVGLRARRESAAGDLGEARARIQTGQRALAEAARRLGLPDRKTLLARRPTAAALATAEALIRESHTHDAARGGAEDALAKAQARLSALGRDTTETATAVADPRGARAVLDDLAALSAAQRTVDLRRADHQAATRRFDEARLRAGAADWSEAAIRARPLPERPEVERFVEGLHAAARAVVDAERRTAEADERKREAEARISALGGAGEVPDDAAIASARAARTTAWDAARAILFEEVTATPSDRVTVAHRMERTIDQADVLADRRAAAADRLAFLQAAREDAARTAVELQRAARTLSEARDSKADASLAWQAIATRFDLGDAAPHEVLVLLDRYRELAALAEAVDAASAEADLAAREFERLDEAATALGRELGLQRSADAGWNAFLPRLRQAVEDLEARWIAARDRDRDLKECRARAEEARTELRRVAAEQERWVHHWAKAMAAIGLDGDARIEAASAALRVWAELPEHVSGLEQAGALVERLTAECADFDRTAEGARVAHAPDLPDHIPPGEIVARLADRLREARRLHERREELTRRLAALDDRIHTADAMIAAGHATLSRLRDSVGAAPDADLGDLVEAARSVRGLRQRIAEERDALAADTGLAEEALRREAAKTDADRLTALAAEIAERLAEEDRAHESAVARRTTAQNAWSDLQAREGAEAAAQAEQNALASLAETADDWRVLQAAGRLLGAVVEEYRRRHQNPVLGEAGSLFSELTRGRYPGLAADFDDEGRAKLVALREDGRRLDPSALSEGTRDQLFLALRLATLIDHGRRAEPMPFVGDDLFVTFDEVRTAAGLSTLARFGETAQAILFTHHEHVVEIAQATLGERVGVVRLGT